MIFVYIICPNKKEAQKIGQVLIEKRLVGCLNIFPIESIYWWKKKIVKDKEVVLIAKTLKKNFKKVEETVKKLHSYEIPCIVALSVAKVNKEYLDWLKGIRTN